MTGQERILTALSIKEADRVPLYIHGINERPIIGIGRMITEGLPEEKSFYQMNNQEKLKTMEALFLIHEHFEVDGLTAFELGNNKMIDETHLQDDFGVVFQINPYGIPVPMGHPVNDKEDLKKYKPPIPKREHFMLLESAKQRLGEKVACFWMMRGTFVRSWRIAGMENVMMKMFDDPEFYHTLAGMIFDYNMASLDILTQLKCDVLIVEDDIADKNFPLIAPEQFKEFIWPYNKKIVEEAHKRGMKVIRHSDGNLWPLMDLILEAGYDGLNPLEPQADMDLKKVKDYCGDRLCLLGNIDSIELLPHGTTEQVREAVKEAIDKAARGGGLIIASSNSLHQDVKPENCIAMFEATKEFGKYPISL